METVDNCADGSLLLPGKENCTNISSKTCSNIEKEKNAHLNENETNRKSIEDADEKNSNEDFKKIEEKVTEKNKKTAFEENKNELNENKNTFPKTNKKSYISFDQNLKVVSDGNVKEEIVSQDVTKESTECTERIVTEQKREQKIEEPNENSINGNDETAATKKTKKDSDNASNETNEEEIIGCNEFLESYDGRISQLPDFAVVFSFFEMFGSFLEIPLPSITELENAITNLKDFAKNKEDMGILEILHMKLLRKLAKSSKYSSFSNVQSDRIMRILLKFCHTIELPCAWDLEQFGYHMLNSSQRLLILKALCEIQFDENPKFRNIVQETYKDNLTALRLVPFGYEQEGLNVWFHEDTDLNVRVYAGEEDDSTGDTWKVRAGSAEEIEWYISKLKSQCEVNPKDEAVEKIKELKIVKEREREERKRKREEKRKEKAERRKQKEEELRKAQKNKKRTRSKKKKEVEKLPSSSEVEVTTEESEELDDDGCARCYANSQSAVMLLCDGCDAAYHMLCLRPPVVDVPDGDWYCPFCQQLQLIDNLQNRLVELKNKIKARERKLRAKERMQGFYGIRAENILQNGEADLGRRSCRSKRVDYKHEEFDQLISEAVSTNKNKKSKASSDSNDAPDKPQKQSSRRGRPARRKLNDISDTEDYSSGSEYYANESDGDDYRRWNDMKDFLVEDDYDEIEERNKQKYLRRSQRNKSIYSGRNRYGSSSESETSSNNYGTRRSRRAKTGKSYRETFSDESDAPDVQERIKDDGEWKADELPSVKEEEEEDENFMSSDVSSNDDMTMVRSKKRKKKQEKLQRRKFKKRRRMIESEESETEEEEEMEFNDDSTDDEVDDRDEESFDSEVQSEQDKNKNTSSDQETIAEKNQEEHQTMKHNKNEEDRDEEQKKMEEPITSNDSLKVVANDSYDMFNTPSALRNTSIEEASLSNDKNCDVEKKIPENVLESHLSSLPNEPKNVKRSVREEKAPIKPNAFEKKYQSENSFIDLNSTKSLVNTTIQNSPIKKQFSEQSPFNQEISTSSEISKTSRESNNIPTIHHPKPVYARSPDITSNFPYMKPDGHSQLHSNNPQSSSSFKGYVSPSNREHKVYDPHASFPSQKSLYLPHPNSPMHARFPVPHGYRLPNNMYHHVPNNDSKYHPHEKSVLSATIKEDAAKYAGFCPTNYNYHQQVRTPPSSLPTNQFYRGVSPNTWIPPNEGSPRMDQHIHNQRSRDEKKKQKELAKQERELKKQQKLIEKELSKKSKKPPPHTSTIPNSSSSSMSFFKNMVISPDGS